MRGRIRRKHERGQVLVIVAGALVVIVAMVGLVIDGGYAWGKQRETQNAADAAAEAGAVPLAENYGGVTPARTDADVLAAVDASGNANGIGNPVAYYTDISGNLLTSAGAVTADVSQAALVGGGAIPTGASGVKAIGSKTFATFIMRVIGINQLTSTATATAVAGYLSGTCSAEAGCIILPITVPITVLGCTGTNQPQPVVPTTYYTAPSGPVSIPLCSNGPGNVGWLDWTPPNGGTQELIQAILTPSNPYLKWPGWYYITSTGNVNSQPLQTALRSYDGQPVQFPQFDATCDAQPTGPGVSDCPSGHLGGNGQQQWYHLAQMMTFVFCSSSDTDCAAKGFNYGAYLNGNNQNPCDTGNGATSCLAGKFEKIVYEGEVSAAPGPNPSTSAIGIQLIH